MDITIFLNSGCQRRFIRLCERIDGKWKAWYDGFTDEIADNIRMCCRQNMQWTETPFPYMKYRIDSRIEDKVEIFGISLAIETNQRPADGSHP